MAGASGDGRRTGTQRTLARSLAAARPALPGLSGLGDWDMAHQPGRIICPCSKCKILGCLAFLIAHSAQPALPGAKMPPRGSPGSGLGPNDAPTSHGRGWLLMHPGRRRRCGDPAPLPRTIAAGRAADGRRAQGRGHRGCCPRECGRCPRRRSHCCPGRCGPAFLSAGARRTRAKTVTNAGSSRLFRASRAVTLAP
ncbi:MAG: hypothetical protein K0S14_449 [Thermomicrobiales bacterium]|nr:hypothetical protein [Thermomicrobiales bacterium]